MAAMPHDSMADELERLAKTHAGEMLGRRGFAPEAMGGNLTAFLRKSGDIEIVVTNTETHGQAPEMLTDPVALNVFNGSGEPILTLLFNTVQLLDTALRLGTEWTGGGG